ncbi:DUF4388 domain-containing protein [bacterium]|nr:DUF4388 domain-containing protein [bacterium]
MIAEGSLQDFSFSDLIQIIGLNASTGTLRLSSEGREGTLACAEGRIVGAQVQDLSGEEAVYALFHWDTGAFAFDPGTPAALPSVTAPLGELAQEGIRRLDRWRAVRAELSTISPRARFRTQRRPLPEETSSLAAELAAKLEAAEGKTLAELAREVQLDELSVATALIELHREGALIVETAPDEALRSVFRRLCDELYARFASISGLKMTEGLEALLNEEARARGVELRWRSGAVQDGVPATQTFEQLRDLYKAFLTQALEYVTKIHGPGFTEKVLADALEGATPEERNGWEALDLPVTTRTP